MAGLGTILGGFGMAEQGAEQGIRQAKADQMQDRSDELRTQQLAAQQQLLPQQTAVAKQQLTSASGDLTDKETLRPNVLQKNQDDLALAHVKAVNDVALSAAKGVIDLSTARDQLMGHLGMTVASGDSDGVAAMINELAKTPAFPKMKSFGTAVGAAGVNAPEGSKDIAGNPISGPALQIKFDNGTTQLLNPQSWSRQTAMMARAADQANIKTIKPGEKIVNTRTGATLVEGNERPYGTLVQDADGNWINLRTDGTAGAGAGGRGKGAGAGAKPEVTTALDNILKNASEKLPPDQVARAQLYAERIMASGVTSSANEAALVAYEAAAHPEKITQTLNTATGGFDDVIQDPRLAGGKAITIAPNTSKPEDLAKTMRPEDLQAQTQRMLDGQTPRVRQMIDQYASGPDGVAAVEQQLRAVLPPDQAQMAIDNTRRKAALSTRYSPKAVEASKFKVGGLQAPAERFQADPRIPKDISQRAAAAQTSDDDKSRNEAEDKRLKDSQLQKRKDEVSWITPAAVRGMTREQAQKYMADYSDAIDPIAFRALIAKAIYGTK